MIHTDNSLWGLPDPDTQAEFYADVPLKRALAWGVDIALVFGLTVLISFLTLGIGFFVFVLLLPTVDVIYRTVTLANRSATPGMRLTAIELRKANGERLDLATAVLHTAGYYISWSFFLLQIASIVLMLATPRGQGVTDHLLGTAAVNTAAKS
ncbi:MAG: hypothetical protein CSA74_08120 [Rhodobacterales bacterium]|nr:MAG: hypothetical protein CSA74_08120 [Rhodobacterales bacterium]